MKTAVLIYYLEQIPTLTAYLKKSSDVLVIALGADIERALTEAGIPFRSGEDLRTVPPVERLAYAEKVAQSVFNDTRLAFLSHRDVPFGKTHALGVQEYLAVFLYYVDMLQTLITRERVEKLVALQSSRRAFVADVLADSMEAIVEDAARLVASTHAIEFDVLAVPGFRRIQQQKSLFVVKRMLFGGLLLILNAVVSVLRRPKPVRLLISDVWRNCEPYLKELTEGEVVLWERTEAQKIGWKNILHYRMRFMHADAFSLPVHAQTARRVSEEVCTQWNQVKSKIETIETASFAGVSLKEVMLRVVDLSIREGTRRDVEDIEDIYRMLERLKPQVVLVRASESLQTHFPFLCYVAEALGIPAIEVQHGLLYVGPGSFASHPAAKRMATYGPLASREFAKLGVENLYPTGSPRFDQYAKAPSAGKESGTLQIAYAVSTLTPGWWIDTYDVKRALEALSGATSRMGAKVRVVVRPDSPYAPFLKNVVATLAEKNQNLSLSNVPLQRLIDESDLFLTGFSTVLLEALLAGKVAVYDGTMPMYGSMLDTETLFREVPVPSVTSAADLESLLSVLADSTERTRVREMLGISLAKEYVNDGGASRRFAELVRSFS